MQRQPKNKLTHLAKKASFLVLAFLIILAQFSFVYADDGAVSQETSSQENTAQEAASQEVAPEETQAAEEAPAVTVTAPGNVTIDFKDADIQNVLRILAAKSGVNIVAGKDVTGTVTIRLVDVPWEKALDIVLKTYGYAYDRADNVIRVTTLENLKKEELSTEVYTLNYAQAADIEKNLKDILSERGKVRSDKRSNALVVTDMPTTLQRVSKVIYRLDKPTPQVVIQTKVIEITLGKTDNLGIKWNFKAGLTGAARPTSFPFPARRQSVLSPFLPDGRVETTQSVSTASGTTETTLRDFPEGTRANQPTFPFAYKDEFKFGTLDFSQFQVVLEAIKQRDDAKVLSEPHVVTLNNQQAKILVGEVIAIPTFERNSTTGKMEITGYKDRDLGIRLTVLPQINSADEIVVNVHPEITTLLGYDELTTEIKAPRFSTREAVTQIRVQDGQTIAIGGLIKENKVTQHTKFPLLGNIPVLSPLFSHTGETIQKTDLLFFMTVNVVKDKPIVPASHTATVTL